MGMAAAMPSTRLMGSAYSLSHFSFGLRIKSPQITITSAETAITHTLIRPEVADTGICCWTYSPFSMTVSVTKRVDGSHRRDTLLKTNPKKAAIIPMNSAL